MSEQEKQELDQAWDDILNSCLNDIYQESDDETSKKLDEHKEIAQKFIKDNNISTEASNKLSNDKKVEPSLVVHENKATQAPVEGQIKWDQDVIDLFNEKFPGMDIYNMSLDDLKHLHDDVEALREEFSLIELAYKVLSNGAYGASANAKGFYFYNLSVAGDITGECRALTKYFWNNLEKFFHEDIWERKDLWKKFGFELDESKRELCRSLPVSCYSDTDSVTGDQRIYIREKTGNNTPSKEWRYAVVTFDKFWKYLTVNLHLRYYKNEKGHLMIAVPDSIQVLDWSKTNGFEWQNMRYVMKHKIGKPIFEIESENGKSVKCTNDHSLMVLHGQYEKLNPIRAKDIKQDNDKVICFNFNKDKTFNRTNKYSEDELKQNYYWLRGIDYVNNFSEAIKDKQFAEHIDNAIKNNVNRNNTIKK